MMEVEHDALYYLNLILLTPVILFGLVGNCLSVLTWSRGCHRDTSTAVILTGLAVTDTIVLTMPALEFWFTKIFGLWIRHVNIVTCKWFAFAAFYGPTISSWVIVLVTAERFISIWFPVKVRFICTRLKVKLAILAIVVTGAVLYSPFLVLVKLNVTSDNSTTNVSICDVPKTYRNPFITIWMWLDLCFLFVIPFTLIVLGNSLILYKILKSRKILIREGRYISYRTRVANSFTIRAIALSITFMVCLSPVTIHEVYETHTKRKIHILAYDFIHILLYGNSAFNFILYCAIGSGFRKDLRTVLTNLVKRKKIRLDHQHSNESQARSAIISKRKLSEFIGTPPIESYERQSRE